MPRRSHENVECKVYIGNLGENPPLKEDLQYEFSYYGPLVDVWIARSPPGFAYIEFEDKADAEAACEGLDGKLFDGRKLRVEMARHGGPRGGGGRRRSRSRDRDSRRRRGRSRSRSGDRRRRRRHRSSSSEYSRSYSRSRSRSESPDDRKKSRSRRERSESRDRSESRERRR